MSKTAVPVQQQNQNQKLFQNFVRLILSVLLFIPSITQSHPDCEKHTIEVNIFQICRSYPIHKRNTRDFNNMNQGFVSQNDLDSWNFLGEEPSYIGNTKDKQFSGDSPGPWQHVVWYPTVAAVPPYPPQNPDEGSIINIEDLFDPINYGGAEVQLPIERWRRLDKELVHEIEGFIRHQCCYRGCAYPAAYLELAQRTNLCNHF